MMHYGQDGGMYPGMMGRGMMGFGAMRTMRIAFILMDSDGDGSLSAEEFRAGHDRIFKAMDANKDGRLTVEEMGAFMRGSGGSPRAP
jgi:Ca2+-binding EF-hand superfamily protein